MIINYYFRSNIPESSKQNAFLATLGLVGLVDCSNLFFISALVFRVETMLTKLKSLMLLKRWLSLNLIFKFIEASLYLLSFVYDISLLSFS
jgi:hypothetical protein